MLIDPVIVLAEELHATESCLRAGDGRDQRADLSREARRLRDELEESVPTSAPGAGELLQLAARFLRRALPRHARQLHEIGERMSEGCRELDDLVWLRALVRSLANTRHGRARRLIYSAIGGAAKPVLVYRAAEYPLNAHKAETLSF